MQLFIKGQIHMHLMIIILICVYCCVWAATRSADVEQVFYWEISSGAA